MPAQSCLRSRRHHSDDSRGLPALAFNACLDRDSHRACPSELDRNAPTFSAPKYGSPVAKEELIEMQGRLEEVLPDSRFRVVLDNAHALISYTGGRVRKHRIRVLAGDRVSLEMSPYD